MREGVLAPLLRRAGRLQVVLWLASVNAWTVCGEEVLKGDGLAVQDKAGHEEEWPAAALMEQLSTLRASMRKDRERIRAIEEMADRYHRSAQEATEASNAALASKEVAEAKLSTAQAAASARLEETEKALESQAQAEKHLAKATLALQVKEKELHQAQENAKALKNALQASQQQRRSLAEVHAKANAPGRSSKASEWLLHEMRGELQQKEQEFEACSKILAVSGSMEATISRLTLRLEEMAYLLHHNKRQDLAVALARAQAEAGDIEASMEVVKKAGGVPSQVSWQDYVARSAFRAKQSMWWAFRCLGFKIEEALEPSAGSLARPLSFGVLVFIVTALGMALWQITCRPASPLMDLASSLMSQGKPPLPGGEVPKPKQMEEEHRTVQVEEVKALEERARLQSPLGRRQSPLARLQSPLARLQSPLSDVLTPGSSRRTTSSEPSSAKHYFIGEEEDNSGEIILKRPKMLPRRKREAEAMKELAEGTPKKTTTGPSGTTPPRPAQLELRRVSFANPVGVTAGRVEAMVAELESTRKDSQAGIARKPVNEPAHL